MGVLFLKLARSTEGDPLANHDGASIFTSQNLKIPVQTERDGVREIIGI